MSDFWWKRLPQNLHGKGLEMFESFYEKINYYLVSVWISKCVERVELRLNCLLQMWHWKILSPLCLETEGWWIPSLICEVQICGVTPWTRREWIWNKFWYHLWGWESANGIDGTPRIFGKKVPAANVLYTQAALGANWIRKFFEASQIQTRKCRSSVLIKQFQVVNLFLIKEKLKNALWLASVSVIRKVRSLLSFD